MSACPNVHGHYPTIAYEVSWRIRAVVALRLQVCQTRFRFTPLALGQVWFPRFPYRKIQRIFNFSQGLIIVYNVISVKR